MKFRMLHRFAIRLRWKRWLGPALCAVPYIGSILWLLKFSQTWIAIVLLVPALLIVVLGLLTWFLARIEMYGHVKSQ